MRLATFGLCSRRRKLPHVCFLAVSTSVLKVRLDTKAHKKFSYILILLHLTTTRSKAYMSVYNYCNRHRASHCCKTNFSCSAIAREIITCQATCNTNSRFSRWGSKSQAIPRFFYLFKYSKLFPGFLEFQVAVGTLQNLCSHVKM